jgi:hypothetical protein
VASQYGQSEDPKCPGSLLTASWTAPGSLCCRAGTSTVPRKPRCRIVRTPGQTGSGPRRGPIVGSIGGHVTDRDSRCGHAASTRLGGQRSRVDGDATVSEKMRTASRRPAMVRPAAPGNGGV